MHSISTTVRETDALCVAQQIGRAPREPWRIPVRCGFGWPSVLETAPELADGTPFPTLYWLTCPWLIEVIGREESDGRVVREAERLTNDRERADSMIVADAEYRERRRFAGAGTDPMSGTGIAGQKDPLKTKCLHAHVAAHLAGIADPIGATILEEVQSECADDRCRRLVSDSVGGPVGAAP